MKPYIKIGFFPYPYKRSAETTAVYGKRTARKLVRRLKKSVRQSIKTELKKEGNIVQW